MIRREYNSLGFCCGVGDGAKGFKKAVFRVGNMVGTWKCIGLSDQAWRERIGNAVPLDAAVAIAEVMGTTLMLAETGETFMLSSTPVWVRDVAVALATCSSSEHLQNDESPRQC